MVNEDLELLITVVVEADDERQARDACRGLLGQVGGQIIESTDCSDEEPGCWSVTISRASEERATHNSAAALARAIRTFVRGLGPEFTTPRVCCEPPTAWTVLDDPALVGTLVPGAERLLVEAWAGGSPMLPPRSDSTPVPPRPDSVPVTAPADAGLDEPTSPPLPMGDSTAPRLSMRVDVAAAQLTGAEWQARAVASRIVHTSTVTEVAERNGDVTVRLDLGPVTEQPPQALVTALSALDHTGWQPLNWDGDVAVIRWLAAPRPKAGITELELTVGPPTPEGSMAAVDQNLPPGPIWPPPESPPTW